MIKDIEALEQKIIEVMEEKIRPVLNEDGGDIGLEEITPNGIVRVKLYGACATCGGSHQTLAGMVEPSLKEACPEVKRVELVTGVSEELIAQALKILRKE